jgi:hypothetical protein
LVFKQIEKSGEVINAADERLIASTFEEEIDNESY